MAAIATSETAAVLWLLLPGFPTMLGGFICAYVCFTDRRPIFGKQVVLPNRPVSEKRRGAVRKGIAAALVIYLLLWVPAVGALWSRTDVTQSHVNRYGMFGRLVESCRVEEARAVNVRIFYDMGRYTSGWRISYTATFEDGRSYTFEKLPTIITQIDALFPSVPKTVEGTENFNKLCEEYHLDGAERSALAQVCRLTSADRG